MNNNEHFVEFVKDTNKVQDLVYRQEEYQSWEEDFEVRVRLELRMKLTKE